MALSHNLSTSPGVNPRDMVAQGERAIQEALKELERLSGIVKDFKAIEKRAAQRLEPEVRRELETCWTRTGMARKSKRKTWEGGDYSGALYDAWVKDSFIVANHLGVIVYIARNMPDAVYARAGVFQHGGVRGAGKRGSSKSTERFKQSLKRGVTTNASIGGGVHVTAARPIYFTQDQVDRLAARYAALVAEEMERGG